MLGTVAIALAAVVPSIGRAQPAVPRPPNVLIIVTDDQRAQGTLGVLPVVKKWFGTGGKRFDQAFATTPTCCPSRASIFTGMYAHNHGVLTTQPGEAENLDQSRTLQHHLKQAGYATGLFGKYLNAWDVKTPPPHFDSWGMFSDKPPYYYRNGLWNVNGSVKRVRKYSTRFIERLAKRFVRAGEENDGRPWMMVIAPLAPHAPYVPHPRDQDAKLPRFKVTPAMKEKDRSDKPSFARDKGPSLGWVRWLRARQLRTLMSVNRMIATLRATLAKTRELNNTLAFFTSDNGLMWGEHALVGKGVAYEPAVHVPLMAAWPKRMPGGIRDERLVANIDITPTIYDAVGITPAFPVDGRSLLDTFSRERILLEHWKREDREAPNWAAHRTLDYKYIESYAADHLVVDWREYYDLIKDPWEVANRISPSYVGTTPDPARLRADLTCAGTEGPRACP